jgi:hypothetical protein
MLDARARSFDAGGLAVAVLELLGGWLYEK